MVFLSFAAGAVAAYIVGNVVFIIGAYSAPSPAMQAALTKWPSGASDAPLALTVAFLTPWTIGLPIGLSSFLIFCVCYAVIGGRFHLWSTARITLVALLIPMALAFATGVILAF